MRGVIGFSLGMLLISANLSAQSSVRNEDLRVIQGTPLEKGYQEMLFNYLLHEAEKATVKRLACLGAIQSKADFKQWQETSRQAFLELIGGLPEPRTALNPQVVGEFTREGYVVRKIIFESLPEYYVTANLYVPTVGKPPYAAVLSPCGHSANGKAYDVYQHLFIGLAKRGYVVLTYDPMGQGERYQYWDFHYNRRRFELNEHGMAGIQEYLLGQNFARYRIWDGIRGLDYLTGLPEVDASRIGVTGSSGGGTLTTYISMLDPRVKAASIVTYITSIPKKIEARINDAENDPEQDIAGQLAAGIDHTELVGMIAPRPVLIGAATRDFFPIEGTRRTYSELEQLYKKLGVPERMRMVEFDHIHMYSKPLREATYAWFDRWLKGTNNEAHEPEIATEKDANLQCTMTGQVITSLGGNRLYDFNRTEADRLLAKLEEQRRLPAFKSNLVSKIRERVALPSERVEPRPQKVGEWAAGGILLEKILLETEPGVVVPTRVLIPKDASGPLPAVIYLRDRDGGRDDPALFESLVRHGQIVAVADVRGFGETKSAKKGLNPSIDYFDPRDGMDADFTYASYFLGQPLLGMRIWDALQVATYLRSRADLEPDRISIVGRGWAAVIAVFAAALDPRIAAVAVEGAAASYAEIARSEIYEQAVSLMLPGVLRDFDLADVLGAIAPRPLLVLNPTDELTRKMPRGQALEAMRPVAQAYAAAQSPQAFKVEVVALQSEIATKLETWLRKK